MLGNLDNSSHLAISVGLGIEDIAKVLQGRKGGKILMMSFNIKL